ncbi:cupredoxin domain-containing protein [Streptomyces lydicus]|uniref:cupredoxin domain-containing protein n=1 Tax=Streptomyces lydicus TaxID=47763 RepID=UPI00342EA60F
MRNFVRTALAVATVTLFATATGGCSGGGGGTAPATSRAPSPAGSPSASGPSATPPAAGRITVKDYAFKPAALVVRPGASVTVVNQDSVTHNVTATGGKAFATGSIKPGARATFTAPARPGAYPYFCSIHPYMKALLTVRP